MGDLQRRHCVKGAGKGSGIGMEEEAGEEGEDQHASSYPPRLGNVKDLRHLLLAVVKVH